MGFPRWLCPHHNLRLVNLKVRHLHLWTSWVSRHVSWQRAVSQMSLLIKLRQYWPNTGDPGSGWFRSGSLARPGSLSSPAPFTCLSYHLLIAKALGRLPLLFTGQAQIRFLTTPPGLLCQGKLALQNCSLTGKCVRLFISHSHWKKRWGRGVGGDIILSTELLKGIACHRHFQTMLGFLCAEKPMEQN